MLRDYERCDRREHRNQRVIPRVDPGSMEEQRNQRAIQHVEILELAEQELPSQAGLSKHLLLPSSETACGHPFCQAKMEILRAAKVGQT